jgi:hypothetical protein
VNNPPKKPPLASHLSDTQWRRRAARIRYEIESAFREEGFGDPALIYDEEKDFFRFAEDGVFAFSLGSTPTGGSSGGGGGCTSSRQAPPHFLALPRSYAPGKPARCCVSTHIVTRHAPSTSALTSIWGTL